MDYISTFKSICLIITCKTRSVPDIKLLFFTDISTRRVKTSINAASEAMFQLQINPNPLVPIRHTGDEALHQGINQKKKS